MSEIKHRQEKPSPEIDYAEICIPDGRYLGTGIFKTVTKPGALSAGKAVSSLMIKAPAFQISLNLNPLTKEIAVLLGFANGSDPISRKIYFFPESTNFLDSHDFQVSFRDWEITELSMDGVLLGLKESSSLGIITKGLLAPGTPIPEHVGSLELTVPRHNIPRDIQEKVLDNIFDLSKYYTFYQVNQGNTEIIIYRNTDFQFVYRHYNPTFGEREIKIDFADAERAGARAFFLTATWSAAKNTFHLGLIHSNPKFEGLRQGFALSEDKLRLIGEDINRLEEILQAGGKEEEAHQFLKNNSLILGLTSIIDPISKFKLGDDYETDFVIREIPDGYVLVEIERPGMRLFKKATPPERTQELNHSIEQIENWRAWIRRNHAYVSNKLEGISSNPICWLICGRRTDLSAAERKRLAEINEEHKGSYRIFTYDDLIDRVRLVISRLR